MTRNETTLQATYDALLTEGVALAMSLMTFIAWFGIAGRM